MAVWVAVGVAVFVGVCVTVGVAVFVGVEVLVGVRVAVLVWPSAWTSRCWSQSASMSHQTCWSGSAC